MGAQAELTAVKFLTPFWQAWDMAGVDFGVQSRKQCSPEELTKNFSMVSKVEDHIDKVDSMLKRLQRMHAADADTA